ncbi:MAG: helix-turn-helix transcriptional regulator [Pyrinomonadaceae bacterium]
MKDIEPFYAEVGRLIQAKRNENGMSQEHLAQQLDPKVTRASIANIEAGKQRVLAHTLVQLSKALSVDLTLLIPSYASTQLLMKQSSTNNVKSELTRKLDLPNKEYKKIMAQINTTSGQEKI